MSGTSGDLLLVLCTCPNAEVARTLANLVVERRLAACANILPGITSVYRWEDKVTSSDEHLLIIKTHFSMYRKLETALVEHHPYQVPEVIAFPIARGLDTYLKWIEDNVDYWGNP